MKQERILRRGINLSHSTKNPLIKPSSWVLLYPTNKSSCTQRISPHLPNRWVADYPTVGYNSTLLLGTNSVFYWRVHAPHIWCSHPAHMELTPRTYGVVGKHHSCSALNTIPFSALLLLEIAA